MKWCSDAYIIHFLSSFWTVYPTFALCPSVVNCTEPGHVENSIRQVLSSGPHRYSFQTTVVYRCNPGYYLLGTSSISCQGDGTWDRSLPKCLCEYLRNWLWVDSDWFDIHSHTFGISIWSIFSCSSISFSNLFDPIWAVVLCDRPSVPPYAQISGDRRTVGSVIRYSCIGQRTIIGNTTRMCQLDGQWSGSPPHCSGMENPDWLCDD